MHALCKTLHQRHVCFFSCSGVVLQVLFHPKQLTLVTSGDDADVRVWDLVNKSCIAVLKVGSQAHCPPPPPLSVNRSCAQDIAQNLALAWAKKGKTILQACTDFTFSP